MITKSKEEQIKINLEDINLDLIQETMKFLDWTWKDSSSGEKRVPNNQELAIVARDCMESAWKSEDGISSIGAFEAEVIEGVIELRFVLTKSNPLSKLLG